jgi:hypothetical protein
LDANQWGVAAVLLVCGLQSGWMLWRKPGWRAGDPTAHATDDSGDRYSPSRAVRNVTHSYLVGAVRGRSQIAATWIEVVQQRNTQAHGQVKAALGSSRQPAVRHPSQAHCNALLPARAPPGCFGAG